MTASQSDRDTPPPHADHHAPAEPPAMAGQTLYQSLMHGTGMLFENAVAAQQQQNSLTQGAANQGVMQIYSLDTTAGRDTHATTAFFLASPETGQAVELACSGGSGMLGSREPKALALFCHAHARHGGAEWAHDAQHAARDHAPGEFTRWTDADAEARYRALTGAEPPAFP